MIRATLAAVAREKRRSVSKEDTRPTAYCADSRTCLKKSQMPVDLTTVRVNDEFIFRPSGTLIKATHYNYVN